jgi:DMSO/TMAO reductase YedYZ molybdopterin-dependent catalytic subunit
VARRSIQRGIHELFAEDPERAEALLWGRRVGRSRRGFLQGAGLAAMSAAVGATIPFARHFPAGLIPAALARSETAFEIPGKHKALIVLNDRPLNAETPAHLLDDDFTPADRMFVRNNGLPPDAADPSAWRLTVAGESVAEPITFTLDELKDRFAQKSYALTLECGGNGRKEFFPPAKGNQWSIGAVACPRFTGVRLHDVLKAAKADKKSAVYVGYEGADRHLSGDASKLPISRGVPYAKANKPETLLAWEMNGEPLPALHGGPVRLVAGGWPASASGKWLRTLLVRDRLHDGAKMGGQSYRVPCEPVRPGQAVDDDEMCIIESMPVKSLITFPASGLVHPVGEKLEVRGHAWAGELKVKSVEVSVDFGATWTRALTAPPKNRLAWQRFKAKVKFPGPGYYEVWARAKDSRGARQPMVVPGWNPKGYLNNACHRIAVRVTA